MTLPTSRTEDGASGKSQSQEARRPLHEARAHAAEARRALWETWRLTCRFGDGEPFGRGTWRCGPDSPPGVGWKLTKKNQPDRFYKDRETAWAKWNAAHDQWLADEPIPKRRKPA